MSLAIEGEFAEKYKKFNGTDNFWVSAHGIGHYFMDWVSEWITENPENKLDKELNTPGYQISSVKKAFEIFIGNLQAKSIKIPEELQEKAFQEYITD